MRESLRRLLQAVRFEREAFVWMGLNDRATGDAVIFVAVTQVLILLGIGWSVLRLVTSLEGLGALVGAIIGGIISWLIYSGVVYAIARFLFQAGGDFPTILRIVGFAYPTMLLQIATVKVFSSPLLAFITGSLWFLAVVAAGIRYESDLDQGRAIVAAAGGIVGLIIVQSILGGGIL